MSNQTVDGFQGSQPFITDNQYKSLSLEQLRYILNQKKKSIKKNYKELSEKEKLIRDIRKLDKLNEKVKQGIDIKKKYQKHKKDKKVIDNPGKLTITRKINKKIKTFNEYFKECIKNREIPKDTPPYLKEALERAMIEYDQGLVKEKSSLDDFANKYVIEGIFGLTPIQYFERIAKTLIDFFTYHKNIKFRLVLVCIMEKQVYDKKIGITAIETSKAYFSSETLKNLRADEAMKLVEESFRSIETKIQNFTQDGSAWQFKEVEQLEIHTVEFKPTKGSSYIPLPKWIKDKGAIVNIQNKDDKCFLWCILRYLYPKKDNDSRLSDLKKYEFSLNTKGITFPMKLKDIIKFEKLNPDLPGINVFSEDNKNIYPLKMAERDCKNTIDLFLIEEDGKSHYTLIKNFSRLIRSQLTTRTDEPIKICKRCFSYYTKQDLLDKHIKYCSRNKTAIVKMPEPNTFLHFKNYYKQLPVPFVVYADFECFTKPMNSCSPNPKDSYNYNYQKHEPSGFCF